MREARGWAMARTHLPRLWNEHPEYLRLLDRFEHETRAQVARLDDTVRCLHGGWEHCVTSA